MIRLSSPDAPTGDSASSALPQAGDSGAAGRELAEARGARDDAWDIVGLRDDDDEEDDGQESAPGRAWHNARSGPRTWVVPIALLLGAGAGYMAASAMLPARAALSQSGILTVDTTPSGARVLVDGISRGEAPVQLALPAGDYTIAVEGSGFRREVAVRLAAGADVMRHFELIVPTTGAVGVSASVEFGSLDVQTVPSGARVVIAGQARGTTPVTVSGLAPGTHEVTLSTSERTVTQQVEVQAGRPSMLVVPMSGGAAAESGWIAVRSSLPLRILERGRVVGTTESDRIMLPAGRHDLEFVNERLEVRVPQSVTVPGGREVAFDVALPNGQISLNAQPWAEVYVGGARLGETPLGNVSLPVGDHDIVFRHPQLGERRQTVTVRATTPARVSVSFSP